MKKRWLGYAAWLLLTAGLYFFENNTGTRSVLVCSLAIPFIPALRSAFLTTPARPNVRQERNMTVQTFVRRETSDSADVRQYVPGDPVLRIHWKLSARKDDLLVRDTTQEWEAAQELRREISDGQSEGRQKNRKHLWILFSVMLLSILLLLLIPEANKGAQALCNRLFAASEDVNAYAYDYFPVSENQRTTLAVLLLSIAVLSLVVLANCLHCGILPAAAMTMAQCYFGVSFRPWMNVLLYGLTALQLMHRPLNRKKLLSFGALVVAGSIFVLLFMPGIHESTEAFSETVRDRLSRMSQGIVGTIAEAPTGEIETRHVFTQSLKTGEHASPTEREFRLITIEEEQISMPHWINYTKIILLLLLFGVLLILPFTPFIVLNARKKKEAEARAAFQSSNINEAVCAIFHHVILWMEITKCDAGNLLYRQWAGELSNILPVEYAVRFAECAMDFERAAYSDHRLSEEARQRGLDLLKETENLLYGKANWKQRFLLKYWMCLCE